MKAASYTFKRASPQVLGGWTITVDEGRVTITGGTYPEAWGPVETGPASARRLLEDLEAVLDQYEASKAHQAEDIAEARKPPERDLCQDARPPAETCRVCERPEDYPQALRCFNCPKRTPPLVAPPEPPIVGKLATDWDGAVFGTVEEPPAAEAVCCGNWNLDGVPVCAGCPKL